MTMWAKHVHLTAKELDLFILNANAKALGKVVVVFVSSVVPSSNATSAGCCEAPSTSFGQVYVYMASQS